MKRKRKRKGNAREGRGTQVKKEEIVPVIGSNLTWYTTPVFDYYCRFIIYYCRCDGGLCYTIVDFACEL